MMTVENDRQRLDFRVLGFSCNDLKDLLGVETPEARLAWRIESSAFGVRQTAYRLLVASTNTPLLRKCWECQNRVF